MDKRLLVISLGMMLGVSLVPFLGSSHVSATLDNMEGVMPGATDSLRFIDYQTFRPPRYTTSPYVENAWVDGWDSFSSIENYAGMWVQTSGYTQGMMGAYIAFQPAPWNATIVHINATAIVVTGMGFSTPLSPRLSYTINGGTSWNTSGVLTLIFMANLDPPASFYRVSWNITALESWTANLTKSDNFQVKLTWNALANHDYEVDYVGIQYHWYTGTPAGTPAPPSPTDVAGGDVGLPSVMGILGIAGFTGLIAMPAIGIIAWRNSDNRGALFLKMLAAMAFCFGLFMASIAT